MPMKRTRRDARPEQFTKSPRVTPGTPSHHVAPQRATDYAVPVAVYVARAGRESSVLDEPPCIEVLYVVRETPTQMQTRNGTVRHNGHTLREHMSFHPTPNDAHVALKKVAQRRLELAQEALDEARAYAVAVDAIPPHVVAPYDFGRW